MAEHGDWTWVLERTCHDCGFDTQALPRNQLAARVRALGGSWRELLNQGRLTTQPDGDSGRSWTPLEYGAHVRDVFDIFEDRARTMLKKRKPPTFRDWDQDEAARKGNYAEEDPAKVAYDLASNAGKYADLIDRVSGDEWEKRGTRSDGAEFTVESLTRYVLHDVEHHLWDAIEIIDG